jgi:hypothetical protein
MPHPLQASGVTFRRPRGELVPADEYSGASIFLTAPARTLSYPLPQQTHHAEVAKGYQAELAASRTTRRKTPPRKRAHATHAGGGPPAPMPQERRRIAAASLSFHVWKFW